MRGKPNTEIEITISRQGLEEGFDLKLIREIIKVPGVLVNVKGEKNDIGYIRVSSFNEKTSDELYKEIIKFEFNPNNQIKSYILDLRRNPGGLLNQAIQVTNFFLDDLSGLAFMFDPVIFVCNFFGEIRFGLVFFVGRNYRFFHI